jgi:GMC oxidoreductase
VNKRALALGEAQIRLATSHIEYSVGFPKVTGQVSELYIGRMKDGVVNSNCQVHGIRGLYVAGSSVFPTSRYADPTLTIVALARRIADHLSNRVSTTLSDRCGAG